MKDRVLKLCKRLNNFTLPKIEMITGMDEAELLSILNELVSEGQISESDGNYSFHEKISVKAKYVIFQKYPSFVIDLVIRCFCEKINTERSANITGVSAEQVRNFYSIFRELIYIRQREMLNSYYKKCHKFGHIRNLYDQPANFYLYNNKVYVSIERLQSDDDVQFNNSERQEFKKIYCYVARCIKSHTQNAKMLHHKIAEALWRRNCGFNDLYYDLTNNLIS